MRIVLGVLAADSCQVRWAGERVTFETRQRIGYMPAERGLYPSMRVLKQLVHLTELHGLTAHYGRAAAGTGGAPSGTRPALVLAGGSGLGPREGPLPRAYGSNPAWRRAVLRSHRPLM
jgi:hypothetical protein